MTAIAGIVGGAGADDRSAKCESMILAQACYGPHHRSVRGVGEAAFGRSLYRMLPEDIYDAQPLETDDGRHLLVADVRLDNRADLLRELRIDLVDRDRLSDADVLFLAYRRWQEGVLDRLAGDFAFAVWDSSDRTLLLARDPLGQRPLHYAWHEERFAFSSMPMGLHAIGIEVAPDARRIAEFLLHLPQPGGRVAFKHIEELPPGHSLQVTPHGSSMRRYWDPSPRDLRLPKRQDYIDAYREQLDRAVLCRLRGSDGTVASQLSSGFDSSAVTATAAKLLKAEGGRVVAFTAAPREGFDGPVPRGRRADESGIAAVTAALYPNIEHVILRPDGTSPFVLLDPLHAFAQHPGGNICNNVWWSAIHRACHARGVPVLLTGEQGNMTISAGGLMDLADLVRRGRLLEWLQEAASFRSHGGVSWKGLMAGSFGAWLPLWMWHLLTTRFQKTSTRDTEPFLLAEPLRSEMTARVRREGRDVRPPNDSRRFRVWALQRANSGNFRKGFLAMWGVDERDPTADIRLTEFCLSLPPEQLLKAGVRRPLARAALSDRLPQEVLDADLRGYQMADWYERIHVNDVRRTADQLSRCPAARSVVDFQRIEQMLDHWPAVGWDQWRVITDYRFAVLGALAVAHFISAAATSRAQDIGDAA